MSRQGRWLFLFCLLSLIVGLLFGLRFATTFGDAFRRITYIPIRGTACAADQPQAAAEYDGEQWAVLWP